MAVFETQQIRLLDHSTHTLVAPIVNNRMIMGCVITNKEAVDVFVNVFLHINGDTNGVLYAPTVIVPSNMALGAIPDNTKTVLVGSSTASRTTGDSISVQIALPTTLNTGLSKIALSSTTPTSSLAASTGNSLVITGGGGTGAAGTYDTDGTNVTAVRITTAGSGYTTSPTIALTAADTGGATFTSTLGGVDVIITTVEV